VAHFQKSKRPNENFIILAKIERMQDSLRALSPNAILLRLFREQQQIIRHGSAAFRTWRRFGLDV